MVKHFLATFSLALAISTIAPLAQGYIPPYWMIMSRVAENHGKGQYQLEQRVEFEDKGETLTVRERWTIEDEDSFRLEAVGLGPLANKIRLTYVYNNGRRHYIDANGIKKTAKIPDDFFEPYLHFRRSKVIKPKLVSLKILPAVTLKSESHRYSERNPIPAEENFVRLAKTGGVVTYAVGEPSPVDANPGKPGIWIEQDQFNLRRLRFHSGTEIKANNYQKSARDAWFPGEILVTWAGTQSAKIVLNKATALPPTKATKDLLDSSSLNFGKDPQVATLLPDDKVISSYYQTLR